MLGVVLNWFKIILNKLEVLYIQSVTVMLYPQYIILQQILCGKVGSSELNL